MENNNLPHKKRRHDGNYPQKYHQRYKKNYREEDRNWRQSDNFRDENRFHNRKNGNHGRYRDSESAWDIQIDLIGFKVKDPMIHVCETCSLPIRSYGRMIPCKHVFCFSCAKKTDNNCPRCKESVQRIEQCPLGSVWLCSITQSCKRTYLSQRDLQAHINHRHNKPPVSSVLPHPLVLPPVSMVGVGAPPITVPPPQLIQPPPGDPFLLVSAARNATTPTVPAVQPGVVDTTPRPSSNLITIQIQDNQSDSYPPPPPPGRPANQPQIYTNAPKQPTTMQY
ncbi:unnamed protein product [Clavelina lepadiformis]|uniref:E3 ubiquitin-protein ligase Hakai n=1 Tax=Clavelina lepadiformis TaxID=159417 RepID=A0ABP0F879_CLALP